MKSMSTFRNKHWKVSAFMARFAVITIVAVVLFLILLILPFFIKNQVLLSVSVAAEIILGVVGVFTAAAFVRIWWIDVYGQILGFDEQAILRQAKRYVRFFTLHGTPFHVVDKVDIPLNRLGSLILQQLRVVAGKKPDLYVPSWLIAVYLGVYPPDVAAPVRNLLANNMITAETSDALERMKHNRGFSPNIMINELIEEGSPAPEPMEPQPTESTRGRKVFLVHGHDRPARDAVASFIRKVNLEPVILAEEPTEGRTVIEALEHYGKADFAVVLFTPDDKGGTKDASLEQLHPRARQNVVLEWGYFAAVLGRHNVCALYKMEVELPSDIHGLLYTEMDEHDAWQLKLAREMKRAGLPVNMAAFF